MLLDVLAGRTQSKPRPRVEIGVRRDTEDAVELRVADDGPGIPERNRRILSEGDESQLEHGRGIGLRFVNWTVTQLGGDLPIDENDPEGSVVTVRLYGTEQASSTTDPTPRPTVAPLTGVLNARAEIPGPKSMPDDIAPDSPAVLMVDDEKKVADAYALRLEEVADVTLAYGGDEALTLVDDGLVPDVVLLDRHMPGVSGDDVLEALRVRDIHTRIVMVTAIDPGLGILDLPFDDYLCKPVERADLRTAVDQQCRVLAYELLGEYFQTESKRAVVEAELPPEQLEDEQEFAALQRHSERLENRVRRLLPEAGDLLDTFSGIDRNG